MNAQKYNIARDGFMYLLSYATLVISSVGFNFLAKALVDRAIPDAVGGWLGSDATVIGFLAAVLVAFPIFVYVNWLANKMLLKGKMHHDTGVRHWLIYITLVVVILIIIWQLISLFISFWSGGLAARFVIHTLITLVIAIAVLGYHWWQLKFFAKDRSNFPKAFKVFSWATIGMVALVVLISFFVVESPAEQRALRFDSTRVNRLADMQNNIQSFYGWGKELGHGRLPKDLDELKSDPRVYIPADGLVDPKTKERFEYRVIDAKTYELCAVFERESKDAPAYERVVSPIAEPSSVDARFEHEAGRECFELSVE